ncbi:TPA: hypothetical protein DCX16_02570 [bacterium]|nr:hypothetical protein [bacterium]
MSHFFAIFILIFLILFYFYPVSLLKAFWITGDLGYSDLTDYYFPIKVFLGECLKNFSLPLWCPHILSGIPIFQEGEIGTLYPLNLIFFSILDPISAYNLTTIISFLICGISTYLFVRLIGISFLPSIFASVCFVFSGYLIVHLKHPSNLMTASLFPFLLYFAERFIKEGKLKFAIFSGIILSFQVFSGHPQIMVYTNLLLVLYFFTRFGLILLEERRKKKKRFGPLFIRLLFLPIMGIVGIGLAAIQLFPTFELLEHSGRKLGGSIHELDRFPFHPKELIRFILPYFYGDPAYATHETPWDGLFWENTGYVGILPLILSFVAISRIKKNPHILFWTIILILSLLLSFGKYSPFLFLLEMPPLSSYRFPNRFLLISDFSLVILSSFGMQIILEKIKIKLVKIILPIIISIITFVDLYKFGYHQNPSVPINLWKKIPESVQFLKEDKDIFRIYSVGTIISRNNIYFRYGWLKNSEIYAKNREVLSVNTNIEHGLSTPGIYLTLFPIRPFIFENAIGGGFILDSQSWTGFVPDNVVKLLSLLNVKYLISVFSLSGQGIELVKEIPIDWYLPSVKIYKNKNVLPRAFLVPSCKIIYDPNTIIDEIIKPEFDPRYEVILEEKPEELPKKVGWKIQNGCKIVEYKPNKVVIEVEASDDCFLFLSDSNYPGWNAYIDGRKTRIYYANCAFRAIFLNKGKHTIFFKYKPLSFYKGCLISFISLVLVICVLCFKLKLPSKL